MTPMEHPASRKSESMSEEVRGNSWRGPAETENPNTNDDNEEVRGNSSHDLPERREESVPEHRDASEKCAEFWHSRQNYKGFLQKTHWYSRAQSGKLW